jgi:translocation and assembly module TamB
MVETPIPDAPAEPQTERIVIVERAPTWQRVAKWAGIVVAVLVVLAGAAMLGLNTGPGRAFVARQISNTTLASGLNFRVGRIDGSLYGALVLRDVEVRDTKGAFATAPEIALDWRPFSYFANRVDVRSLASPLVKLDRMPALKSTPSDPNAPILPDINIDLASIQVGRIEIGSAVTGQRHVATLAGSGHISDGRAQIDLRGGTLSAPGVAGGDLLALKLDAVPDQNKLDIDLRLTAPANGLVAGLTGVTAPLTFSITGDGNWKNWKGQAVSTLGGGELADLAIQAQDGTFRVRGTSNPGLYLKGPVERLGAPQTDVALDVTWSDRKAQTKLQLRSKALSLSCEGLIDLGNSRYGDLRIDALLLTPGAIAPNLNGREVRVQVALNGPFARPVVDYKVQAASLGFGEMRVEQLYAEGQARVDANRILVPVRARAARVSGLNAAAGGLVTNLSVQGDLAISGDQLLSDNLKIHSDRIDATAIVAADLSEGRYTGALKGRVNDYVIDGIGTVNLTTDAKLFAAPGGGWGIRGSVAAQTAKIYSEGLRTFLGGSAVATSQVSIDAKGMVNFTGLKVSAPDFRITRGSGHYDPNGILLLNADGYSTQYGPLTARVTGPLNAPQVQLRLPRPGLGVGLVGVEAFIKGSPSGAYAITAKGESDYGPFTANVLLQTGKALVVDVRSGRFAGMNIEGRLVQSAAGPFDGQVNFDGSGVSGKARLGAQGSVQRADVTARALNATIPGTSGITIGRAIVNGSIVMTETPQIVGDAQFANLRSGGFTIKTARARIDYRGGSGTAQALATGSSGVPFRVALNARLSPKEWLVALVGVGNGVNFKTPAPAHIAIQGKTYRLMPTRITFDRGSARIAGTYGDGMTLQTRLDGMDLALVNAFVPGLGIGGSATGSLDFAQATPSAFPTGNARIEISDFTRASLSAVSVPVSVTFVGKLLPDGGDARALIRRGTTTIGRMVATLRPLGAGAGSWQERMLAAPLSGGIRYNGPATVLFSLSGLSDQHLDGPLGVAADFSGRVRKPELTGVVRGSNLVYENETYGTRLSKMKIDGRFTSDRLVINEVTAVAGSGTVKAAGTIGLSSADNFPMNVTADLANARLARSDSLAATATGKISVIRDAKGNRVEGRLEIPEARYEIIRQGAAEVAELTGVRRKSDVFRTPEQRAAAEAVGSWDLNLRVRADNQLFISGMGLESEWGANLTVRGTSAAPVIGGSATVVRGDYSFAGKRFTLSRGNIRWEGRELSNPSVEIAASTTTEGVTANINVTGTALLPKITFSSSPNLPQDEILSRLLFGSSVTNLSAIEAIQLAASLNSLRGSGGGLNPLGKLRSATGISRLRVLGADDVTGRGTALAAGQYITDDIYIEIITDAQGFTATQLEIALSRALSILSQTGSFGGSSVSVRYSKDY